MAKTTKGGLGRGLNSLLSGSLEEAVPAENETKDRERVTFDNDVDDAHELKDPALPVASSTTSVESKTLHRFPKESPARPKETDTLNEKEKKTKAEIPFRDYEDNVIIKEVKEREIVKKPETRAPEKPKDYFEADISLIEPNPDQPRTNFKKEEIEELAASIEKNGLLQPILVRPVGGKYQIIAGERRWHACKLLDLKTVPVRCRQADDDKVLELALVENIQRTDLNPIEEAYGYRRLMERKGMTQSEVAETVSKGRSTIANALRLLELPEDAQQLLFEEKISSGHARAILSISNPVGRQKLTEKMVREKISVREAEQLARLYSGIDKKGTKGGRPPIPPSFKSVARALRKTFDTNVKVKSVQGKNKIEIEFKDEEELERLFGIIMNNSNERIDSQ